MQALEPKSNAQYCVLYTSVKKTQTNNPKQPSNNKNSTSPLLSSSLNYLVLGQTFFFKPISKLFP